MLLFCFIISKWNIVLLCFLQPYTCDVSPASHSDGSARLSQSVGQSKHYSAITDGLKIIFLDFSFLNHVKK